MRVSRVVPLLLVAGVATAAAQVRVVRAGEDRLTGITRVDVLVSLDLSNTASCALAATGLAERAAAVLAAAGIKATVSQRARSDFYSIVIGVRSARSGLSCVSSVDSELVAEIEGIPEADRYAPPGAWGSLLRGFMPLLRENALVISDPVEHDSAVQRSVSSQVAVIAAKVRSANRP